MNDKTAWMNKTADRTDSTMKKVSKAMRLLLSAVDESDKDALDTAATVLSKAHISVDALMVEALKRHCYGRNLMEKAIDWNDGYIGNDPVAMVERAVELLNSAVKAANANPDHDSRTKARDKLAIELRRCDNAVDRLMVDALKRQVCGRNMMRDAVGESSPKPDQLTVSERMARVIKDLDAIIMDDNVLAPWADRAKQHDSLETLIDQFNEGIGGLEQEFLAIALSRTTEGRQFMKQAMESFIESHKKEVTPEEALGDVVNKIDDAIDRLNDALRDSRVPYIDEDSQEGSDDPLAEFLIKRICERSCGSLDVYFSHALTNSIFGRRVIKHLIND